MVRGLLHAPADEEGKKKKEKEKPSFLTEWVSWLGVEKEGKESLALRPGFVNYSSACGLTRRKKEKGRKGERQR